MCSVLNFSVAKECWQIRQFGIERGWAAFGAFETLEGGTGSLSNLPGQVALDLGPVQALLQVGAR